MGEKGIASETLAVGTVERATAVFASSGGGVAEGIIGTIGDKVAGSVADNVVDEGFDAVKRRSTEAADKAGEQPPPAASGTA